MTKEEKQLLLKDLCARLPYGVKVKYIFDDGSHCPFELSTKILQECLDKGFLPYLRPMSSMTEEERREYDKLIAKCIYDPDAYFFDNHNSLYDWLNEHHFDYRGLIEQELALEVPKGMYE